MLARRADAFLPAWFQDWVTHGEQLAVRLRWFELLVVPGLLQTEAYARALLTGRIGNHAEDTEARVMARMDRQAVITRDDGPAAGGSGGHWRPVLPHPGGQMFA